MKFLLSPDTRPALRPAWREGSVGLAHAVFVFFWGSLFFWGGGGSRCACKEVARNALRTVGENGHPGMLCGWCLPDEPAFWPEG